MEGDGGEGDEGGEAPRIVCPLGLLGEQLFRGLYDDLVDLAPDDLPQVGVLCQLRHRASISSSHHQHPPRVRQVGERRVHERLVIVGLVPLRDHQSSVDGEHPAEEDRIERAHALEG
ncbi:MAG: hypothetical protein SGPRY_011453, partial [Prymnesium sp.]